MPVPSKAITVNPWHWLNEDATFPADTRLRNRAIRVAQCIEYGGPLARGQGRQTLIPCRFRPGGKLCPGFVFVVKESDDAIAAFCDACTEEEFLIYEWEDTPWAEGQQPPIDPAQELGEELREPPKHSHGQQDEQLQVALDVIGSPMSASEVRDRVARASSPVEVIQAIVDSCIEPPEPGELQRLLPVMMQVWNQTPRAELGGRTPTFVHEAGQGSRKIARNAPCPCGSGRKYKRCCGERQLH